MRPGKNKKQYQLQALVDLPYKVTNNSCLACEQRGDRTVNLRPLCSTPKVTYNDQNTLTMRILIMEMVTNPGHPSLQTFGPFPRTLSPLELNFQRIRDSGPDRPVCNALSDRLEIRIALQNMPIKISHLQHVRVGTWI
ncbi:uncharacterized protein N7473_004570 [Penicillium subrubescens]|uniref:uncharacterized protein n=1 Tax=Penicillium subrubescens TaxID=1316194 RepID=UPI00254536CF|nr:uncharacterized protein N7473_004570 [Penicillium subrubescens]KAJ5900500.1 hypothetical protein N7473_004570 [Penicillium subrubescens]